MTTGFSFGKYRTLALAIALFILLQGGVFVIDNIISRQLQDDAVYERLASRQFAVHLQVIGDSLLLLKGDTLSPSARTERVKLLERTASLFGRTLEVFTSGGSTISKRDIEVQVAALGHPRAQEILRDANLQWVPVATAIGQLARSVEETQFAELAQHTLAALPPLRKQMTELAVLMDEAAAERAALLQLAKVAALSLAAINFLAILYYLVVHLRRSDQALERAQKETADILRTTQEGLFLLDPEYHIGMQHSRVLEGILGTSQFAGANFFGLLQPMVSDKTLTTAREYLELLFKHDVKEKLVGDLNPLNCVQILHGQDSGKPETRFLEFGFNRVKEAGRITHLLVTVNDITQRINLERSLKETEARARDQMSMLIDILQIEPAALQQFMRTARDGLQNMNQLLQMQETGLEARGSKVHALFRQSHRIKGDAAAVGLKNIAAAFERLEDTLTGMHERHNLTGEDFLPIAVQVKGLYEQIEAIDALVTQISQVRGIVTVEPPRELHSPGAAQLPFVQRWRSFAGEIAARQGNVVEFSYDGIDISTLPTSLHDTVNTIVNQFIRNAVAHGIEPPAERRRLNKPEAGRLAVYISRREDGGIDLGFRDDGRGISVEQIRQSAVEKGRLSAEEAASWEPRRIIGLIFESGMSTRQAIDGDAGRGAGLDAVREIVARMGGNIRIGTTVNEYCHFRISFAAPAVPSTQVPAAEGPAT